MKSAHLSDHEIQQVVSDYRSCTPEALQHLHICSDCNNSVKTYRVLFAGLEGQAKPSFDFDLAALVLSSVTAREKKHSPTSALNWSIIAIVAATIGITSYLLSEYLVNLFSGVSTIALYLICLTAATSLAFHAVDIAKKYKNVMTNLNID